MVTLGSFCPCNEGAWASIVGERGTKEMTVRAKSNRVLTPTAVTVDCFDSIFFVTASLLRACLSITVQPYHLAGVTSRSGRRFRQPNQGRLAKAFIPFRAWPPLKIALPPVDRTCSWQGMFRFRRTIFGRGFWAVCGSPLGTLVLEKRTRNKAGCRVCCRVEYDDPAMRLFR